MEKVDTLLSWATDKGAIIDKSIEFVFDDKIKGTHAIVKPKTPTTPLIAIPQKLFITPNDAINHFKNSSKSSPSALLHVFVAKLKFCNEEANNFWKPYTDYLPNKINTPFFWSLEEKSLLKGSDAGIILKRNYLKYLEEWKTLMIDLNLVNNYDTLRSQIINDSIDFSNLDISDWKTFQAYLWSVSIFTSRGFPYFFVNKDGDKDVNKAAFLLPIVDLLNHSDSAKVKWDFNKDTDSFEFHTEESVSATEELFNNYGGKSNTTLLLNYGFVLDKNSYDSSTITLKADQSQINYALENNIKLPSNASSSGINFFVNGETPLPDSLVDFFALLVQLNSERQEKLFTLRMKLDGLEKLKSVVNSKLNYFKERSKIPSSIASKISPSVIKNIKTYMSTQKAIFQMTFDEILKLEKQLLKTHTSEVFAFKKMFNSDQQFKNSLLLTLGVSDYQSLSSKGLVDHAVLLWIVKYNNMPTAKTLQFIQKEFKAVSTTIAVEKADVAEYLSFYKTFFPSLSEKIPEVYKKGNWGIKEFIIAGVVVDRLCFKKGNGEVVFLLKKNSR